MNNGIMTQLLNSLPMTFLAMQALVHFIFAAAVARDAGQLFKLRRSTYLVSGMTWAFATLVGGIYTAGLYWLVHYSSLARSRTGEL